MFDEIDRIELPRGYQAVVMSDDSQRENPWKEDEYAPSMVVFPGVPYRWTNDDDLAALVRQFIDSGRRDWPLMERWLRVCHDVVAIRPLSYLDHSGIYPYLGGSSHPSDPGGWDSSFVGFVAVTGAELTKWGFAEPEKRTPEFADARLVESFGDFEAWVTGNYCGYQVEDAEGVEVLDVGANVWGFIGSDHEKSGLLDAARDAAVAHWNRVHGERVDLFKQLVNA